jgi:hypothetical protein
VPVIPPAKRDDDTPGGEIDNLNTNEHRFDGSHSLALIRLPAEGGLLAGPVQDISERKELEGR